MQETLRPPAYAATGEVRAAVFNDLDSEARGWILRALLSAVGGEREEVRRLEAMQADLSRLLGSHAWAALGEGQQHEILGEVLQEVEAELGRRGAVLRGLYAALWSVSGMAYEAALKAFHEGAARGRTGWEVADGR